MEVDGTFEGSMASRRTSGARVIIEEPVNVLVEDIRIGPLVLVQVIFTEARFARGVLILGIQAELPLAVLTTALAPRNYPRKVCVQPEHGRLSNSRPVGQTAHKV